MPTKSDNLSGEGQGAPQRRGLLSEPRQPIGSAQDLREPHLDHSSRQARQETPRIYSDHAPPPPSLLQTVAPGNRQANPDIQDIITGIVKLLNGNVNVAANGVRPNMPTQQATRYNRKFQSFLSGLSCWISHFQFSNFDSSFVIIVVLKLLRYLDLAYECEFFCYIYFWSAIFDPLFSILTLDL